MKSRLTITLSDSTLSKIDALIDGKKVRNRSHAIENLVERSLRPSVSTAVLLAGGKKSNNPPKPLTVIDDKPLILYTIDLLKKYGVGNLIITLNKESRELKNLLGNGSEYGLKITYSVESKPLGTAGALKALASTLGKQSFFVLSGDILTTIDLDALVAFHTKHRALITMAVKPRTSKKFYDNVSIQGHTVVNFKTSNSDDTVSIVNAGVYVFEPEALDFIPEKTPSMLESDIFPELAKKQKMLAFPFQGIWFDVDSDSNYQKVLKEIK